MLATVACLGLALTLAACGQSEEAPAARPPNVLWVVWDTVRADRMSLYGHERATTPKLDAWAAGARVFENALSAASTTVPSHGAMFTGLLPTQHGAHDERRWLDAGHATIAERLRDAGYRTYLWSANPHVSAAENFHQGFDHEAHPWDPAWRAEALAIVREKVQGDRSSELGRRLQRGEAGDWAIKAAGALAEQDLAAWLAAGDPERPWFAFLNYMEAHRPLVPARRYRARAMTPDQVERSYRVDRSWPSMWAYTFGLGELDEEALELTALTYDAALMELDDLFASLLASLEAAGRLEGTVVILTADHGELLGEHHMLDHQYAVYAPLTRVPLVVHGAGRFAPGRDGRPVQNLDLFPTVLELAGISAEEGPPSGARSLLAQAQAQASERVRLAEYPAAFEDPIRATKRRHPAWDPGPFADPQRAFHEGSLELIRRGDGHHALYDLARDPGEQTDLSASEPATVRRLAERLDAWLAALPAAPDGPAPDADLGEEQRRMLEGLGYLLDSDSDSDSDFDRDRDRDRDAAEPAPAHE